MKELKCEPLFPSECDVCGKETKPHKGFIGSSLPLGWIKIWEAHDLDLNKNRKKTLYAETCGIVCATSYLTKVQAEAQEAS